MTREYLRQLVRTRYVFACGYCGLTEAEMGADFVIDHFQPHAQGGSDEVDNLVYACPSCNAFKGDSWDATNPLILHPLDDDLKLHVSEQADGTLVSLTDVGRRHIDTLQLNRKSLIRRRKVRSARSSVAGHQQSVMDRLTSLEHMIPGLESALQDFERMRRLY